jgi:hypothetical protein
VDIATLHQEAADYSALYNDRPAAAAYLAQHPDLAAYEKAKKSEFEQTPAGLLYSLFYGGSAATYRYMQSWGMGAQDVAQAAQDQP